MPLRATAPFVGLLLVVAAGSALGGALRSGPLEPWHVAHAREVATRDGDVARDGVVPGIEVLLRDSVHLLAGRRIGLLTNHTGRDRGGRRTIDLLHEGAGFSLVAVFVPEHGLQGTARGGARIAGGVDSATGVPIRSLYGRNYAPSRAALADVDVLLYDVQDVGARPYTYVWTMTLAAEAAARLGKRVVVLDRPVPIRGDRIEGGVMRDAHRSLVGREAVPMRYGLTPGELARWLVATGRLPTGVSVVPMRGWRRDMWYEDTGLPWIAPSPNIDAVEAALLFPGIVLFEATNVSEGRGTGRPFRLVGAPWMTDAPAIARSMNARALPGVRFAATTHAVARGEKHGGRTIPMVELTITDRDAFRPVDTGAWLLREIAARHPREFRWQAGDGIEELSGSPALRRATTTSDAAVRALLAAWRREADFFARDVRPFLLYE